MTDEFPAFPKALHAPSLAVAWQQATRKKRSMADVASLPFYRQYLVPNLHFLWLS